MKNNSSEPAAPFIHEFIVPGDVIDENGHVNNVTYIQWMQDIAVLHSSRCGGTDATRKLGCSWVVRSHKIDYLSPTFAGDTVVAATWVANFRKVRSLRRYTFMRKEDNTLLARGETDWVFVNGLNGRPLAIPAEVSGCYPLIEDNA